MNKKIISLILVLILATITLGCGSSPNEREDGEQLDMQEQEEKDPDEIYQDSDAQVLVLKAEEDIEKGWKIYDEIKKDPDLLLLKTSSITNKIDIPNLIGNITETDLNNMIYYTNIMDNNTEKLSKSIEHYDNAINYLKDAEKLNISPEYEKYLKKYLEAIVKERNGVFLYRRGMGNKSRLLMAKTYVAIYGDHRRLYNHYFELSKYQRPGRAEAIELYNYHGKIARESMGMAYYYVPIPELKKFSTGTEIFEGLFKWENDFVTRNMNLSEDSFQEANKLKEEAQELKKI